MEDPQNCPRPTTVVLLGHSFIRRLNTFMQEDVANSNLRLDREKFDVIVRARGGLKVPQLTAREFDFQAENGIVYLQIGGNDIRSNCNVGRIITAITSFAQYLVHAKNVRRVIVGQILRRRPDVVCRHFNDYVIDINKGLESWCKQTGLPISFWKHRGFWDPDLAFLCRDGVHLKNTKQKKNSCRALRVRSSMPLASDH
jgi:hypothetical protein